MTDITIIEALRITAVSMGVVFTTLVVISFVLDLQKLIFYKKPVKDQSTTVIKEKSVNNQVLMTEEEQVIAMATAAHFSTKPNAKIRIKSIKRLI